MGDPHGARSEQEYKKSLMVMKRHRSSQGGRRWQARVGYPCSRSAKILKASKLGGGQTPVDIGGSRFVQDGQEDHNFLDQESSASLSEQIH